MIDADVVDAHLHVWERSRLDYAWLEGAGALNRDYGIHQALELVRSHGGRGCVLVEAHGSLEEARWLLRLADAHEAVLGVVGGAGVLERDGTEDATLEHPKLSGLRLRVASDTDWAAFEGRLEQIAGRGWSCDLLLEDGVPARLAEVLEHHPQINVVLDHLAGARLSAQNLESWSLAVRPFGALEHVHLKLSGYLTAAATQPLEPEVFERYVQTALEVFGAGRLLFGSDHPVCTLAGEYGDAVNALEHVSRPLEPAARALIWGGTATRAYRLEPRATAQKAVAR